MTALIVQTGSVPELLYAIQRVSQTRPARLLALDSENVKQYVRALEGIQVAYFRNSHDVRRHLKTWADAAPVLYIGGNAFPSVQRRVRAYFPHSRPLLPKQQEDWKEFLDYFHSQLRQDSVLLIQTEDREFIEQYLRDLFPQHGFVRSSISLLCRLKAQAAWQQSHSGWQFWTYRSPWQLLGMVPEIRRQQFDACIVFFTGHPGFKKIKLLSMLSGARQKFAVNEHGQYIQITFRALLKFIYQRWRHGAPPRVFRAREGTRVLIVQTWDEERMRPILERLETQQYFYKPRYWLFTREDKVSAFGGAQFLEQILTYPRDAGIRDYWQSLKLIRKLGFEAAVLAFTQEPTYTKLKWMPFLVGIRYKLAFNRHYDCFFFTPARFLRYWTQRYSGYAGSLRSLPVALAGPLVFPFLRGFLFPLRFFYLVITITIRQLRRAYNSQYQ